MKDKIITIIQQLAFIIAVFMAVFTVFCLTMMVQIFNFTTMHVLGKILWTAIYIILPIIVFLVPLVIDHSFKKSALWAIVLILIYALIALGTHFGIRKYMENFTSDKWTKYPYERHLMLADLKTTHNFIGMTKDEIINILGESNQPYADTGDKDIIEYFLGNGWIDPTMLSLEFEDNIVTDAYTYVEFRGSNFPLY